MTANEAKRESARLMEEADGLPWGRKELALVAQSARLAEESGDEEFAYSAYSRLNTSAMHANDGETLITSFAWMLAKHDSDPARFPASLNGGGGLLWRYKWVISRLSRSPAFSVSQVEEAMADMERRYSLAGLGRSGPLVVKFGMLRHLGRLAEADAVRQELIQTPRDSHSDCRACVHSEIVTFLAETGRDAEAVEELNAMLEGHAVCVEEPERALGFALLPLLRVGQMEQAKANYRRGYPMALSHEGEIEMKASYIRFLALTGNTAEALAAVERHLPEVTSDALDSRSHMLVLAAFAVTARVLTEEGFGDLVVAGASDPRLAGVLGVLESDVSVTDLGARTEQAAARIASALDTRNGNDQVSRLLGAHLDSARERYDVPLRIRPFRPSLAEETTLSATDHLARASALSSAGLVEDALDVAGRIDASVDPMVFERALNLRCRLLVGAGRLDAADALRATLIGSLQARGEAVEADMLTRLGWATLGLDAEKDLPRLAVEIERLSAAGAPQRLTAELEATVCHLHLSAGNPDEALAAAERGFAAAEADGEQRAIERCRSVLLSALLAGDPWDESRVEQVAHAVSDHVDHGSRWYALQLLARLAGARGDYAEGARYSDRAIALATEVDLRPHAREAGSLSGALLVDAGSPREAASRYRFALAQAELGDETTIPLQIDLGRALMLAEESDDAMQVLRAVVEGGIEDARLRAEAVSLLAQATGDLTGSWEEAAALWNEAKDCLIEVGDLAGAAHAALQAGRATEDEDYDVKIGLYDEAVSLASQCDDPGRTIFEALSQKAWALGCDGDTAAADVAKLAIDAAGTDEWAVADATDTLARVLRMLDQDNEAVSVALRAADLYRDAGDPGAAGGSEYYAGDLLAELGRHDEAVAVLRTALEAPEHRPGFLAAVRATLADSLEAGGHTDEARELRRQIESGL